MSRCARRSITAKRSRWVWIKDDTIVRRRLRQKLEFITDDVAAMTSQRMPNWPTICEDTPDFRSIGGSRSARLSSIRKARSATWRGTRTGCSPAAGLEGDDADFLVRRSLPAGGAVGGNAAG